MLVPAERRELGAFLANLEAQQPRSGADCLSRRPAALLRSGGCDAVGAALSAPLACAGPTSGDPSTAPDEVGVVVERVVVTLPACPNWTEWPNNSFSNQPTSNWGCSTAVDLGMMVAEPSDLNFGRVPGPSDGTVMSSSIERYRLGKTKPMIRDAGSSDVYPPSGN